MTIAPTKPTAAAAAVLAAIAKTPAGELKYSGLIKTGYKLYWRNYLSQKITFIAQVNSDSDLSAIATVALAAVQAARGKAQP